MNEPMFRLDEDRGVRRRRFANPASGTGIAAKDVAQPVAPRPSPLATAAASAG
jgi:hypothetical protein